MKQIFAIILLASFAIAQAAPATKPTEPVAAKVTAADTSAKPSAATTTLPTKDTVDKFLKHMFAGQAGASWTIENITAVKDSPGVADVQILFPGAPASTHLYILPGGHYAIDKSQLVPFGADPFASIRKQLQVEAHGYAKGSVKPDVTLVVFSDLECPHCKLAEPVLTRIVAEVPNVRLIFQPMPLYTIHKWAFKGAQYAECIGKQDEKAFWTFLDAVFDAQANMKDDQPQEDKFIELTAASGADIAKTSACVAEPSSKAAVQKSYDLGTSLGVNGTPTVFVNGKAVHGVGAPEMNYDRFKALVLAEAEFIKK